MTSKKELIIKAISEMNVSLLEVLLDDNQTYQGATKETFIEKIDEVFEQFKKSKDTMLSPFSGICKSKSCENKGCTGLAFIGNVSNISMALILDETETDLNDIYNCSSFKIKDKTIKPVENFRIDIKYDEKDSFNPTSEKLQFFRECKKAFNEITNSNNEILTKDKLVEWIEDYYWVREEFKNNIDYLPFLYRSIDNFRDLYNDLDNVVKHIPFEIPTFKAMVEFQNIDVTNERELLSWLVTHEDLRNDLSKLHNPFDSCGVIKMNYLKIHKQPKIRVDLADFSNIIQFKNDFDKHNTSIILIKQKRITFKIKQELKL
jgi:tRNA(Ser,Leu) C12 N-acetylase TAN1